MGAQWKKAGKMEASNKKGAVITKIVRELQVAARMGGPDPDGNPRLRRALDAARLAACSRDTVERAIKKGSGQLEGDAIEECTYEGFAPHQVGVIVECQTDNRTRTASEMRVLFKSHGGQMGESGSVAWMFDRVGLVEAQAPDGMKDPEEEAIEAGANEVEKGDGNTYYFYGTIEDIETIKSGLTNRKWKISAAEPSYKSKNKTDLSPDQRKEVEDFLGELDEFEDSSRVYVTL